MLSLHLQNASFSYSERAPLFSGGIVHLTAGWAGLVGADRRELRLRLGVFAEALKPSARPPG